MYYSYRLFSFFYLFFFSSLYKVYIYIHGESVETATERPEICEEDVTPLVGGAIAVYARSNMLDNKRKLR